MARPKHADTRYLELKNGKYRVTVAVPRALQGKLGTKLKRPLNTDSRATANTLKWAVVAQLKAIIDRAGRDVPQGDHLTREALELATHRVTVRDDQELAQLDEEIVRRAAQQVRGVRSAKARTVTKSSISGPITPRGTKMNLNIQTTSGNTVIVLAACCFSLKVSMPVTRPPVQAQARALSKTKLARSKSAREGIRT
jgi:hypothetical protein